EPDLRIKIFIDIGVAYGTDPNKVENILMDIVNKHPHVIKKPEKFAPIIRFQEFAESSLNFKIIVWVDDLNERFSVKSDINHEIDRRFKEEGVEIPFPQRVLHIKKED
ncbi:MAG: mechanosensitive ion channel, partial [Thermoplasmata archaeon]|nr:mechanosensitive ion channel [Thermoplasmata archaeon]